MIKAHLTKLYKRLCGVLAVSVAASTIAFPAEATAYTKDTFSNKQWAYYGEYNIGIEEVWNAGNGMNKEIIVAVIDVGVDYNHEDLSSVMWINEDEFEEDEVDNDANGYINDRNGYNFFDDNGVICNYAYSETSRQYVDDHGTHIAGIIAAVADNDMGVAGVASHSNVKIMSLKVLGEEEGYQEIRGSVTSLIKAIEYAEANGASICNMSLGYTVKDEELYQAMKNSNMLFICAAGNGMESTGGYGFSIDEKPEYPAAYDLDNIISVANMNEHGYIDLSSCYGEKSVDIAAPGTNIASTVVIEPDITKRQGKYMLMTGTSMAAPMVTGAAAILASYYDGLTNLEIKEAILNGATVNLKFGNKVAGNRMLNVAGALRYCKERIALETEITPAAENSNNKMVTAKLGCKSSPVMKAVYAEGAKEAEDFVGGFEGIPLEWEETKASFEVNQTGIYTIYVVCEDGTELTKEVFVEVPMIKKLKLSKSEKTMKKGSTYQLEAIIKPTDLYTDIVFKSSNSKVASVNEEGKITAKAPGKAKIKVIVKDGNTKKKAVCKVVVIE